MKTKTEVIYILRQHKTELMQKYHLSSIGVFGSVARGEQTEDSDVDICFESEPLGLFALGHLQSEIEGLLQCSVDLLRMRQQLEGTQLKKSIMRDVVYV